MWVSMVVVMVEGSDGTPETQSPGHCECEARDPGGSLLTLSASMATMSSASHMSSSSTSMRPGLTAHYSHKTLMNEPTLLKPR